MLFTPALQVTPNSTVTSSAVIVTSSGPALILSGDAQLVVNSTNRGASYAVVSGDALAISITDSGSAALTATHVSVSVAGVVSSFTCVTQGSASGPQQVYVTGTRALTKSSVCTTNEMGVWGAGTSTYNLSIPHVHAAFITKNGVFAGESTTVVEGDVFYITYTTPATANTSLLVPIFLADKYAEVSAVTIDSDTAPTGPYFTDVLNAARNAVVQSNLYTVSGLDPFLSVTFDWLAAYGLPVIKNGVSTPVPCTVVNGDTLRLQLTSSALHSTVSYLTASLGSAELVWAVSTERNTDGFIDPIFHRKGVYDVPLQGSTHATLNQNNLLVKINSTTLATSATSLYNPTLSGDASANPFIFAASYYEGLVYKVSEAGVVASTQDVGVGSSVYGITYAPAYNAAMATPTRQLATISGASNVVRELGSANPDIVISGSGALYGIATTRTGKYVYVATAANTVAVLTCDTPTSPYYVLASVNLASYCTVPGGLRDITVDGSGNVWVADVYNRQILCVNGVTRAYLGASALTTDPWGISSDSTYLWVAGSSDNTLVQINLTTRAVVRTIQVRSVPSTVVVDPTTGYAWVGYYGCNYVTVHGPLGNYATSSTLAMPQPVTGLVVDGIGSVWALCLYKNLATFQSSRVKPASPMNAMAFTPVVEAPLDTVVLSNAVVVSGMARPATLSVPPMNNYRIVISGVEHQSVLVQNGDVISLSAKTPLLGYYKSLTVDALSENVKSTWNVRTLSDTYPDPLYFDAITNSIPTTAILSTEDTVTGITAGSTVHIRVASEPSWRIVVNGVDSSDNTATVTLGDLVKLSGNVSGLLSSEVVTKTLEYQNAETLSWVVLGTLTIQAKIGVDLGPPASWTKGLTHPWFMLFDRQHTFAPGTKGTKSYKPALTVALGVSAAYHLIDGQSAVPCSYTSRITDQSRLYASGLTPATQIVSPEGTFVSASDNRSYVTVVPPQGAKSADRSINTFTRTYGTSNTHNQTHLANPWPWGIATRLAESVITGVTPVRPAAKSPVVIQPGTGVLASSQEVPRTVTPAVPVVALNPTRCRIAPPTVDRVWHVREAPAPAVLAQGLFLTPEAAVADGTYRGYVDTVPYEMTTIVTDNAGNNIKRQAFMWVVPNDEPPIIEPPIISRFPTPHKRYVSGG